MLKPPPARVNFIQRRPAGLSAQSRYQVQRPANKRPASVIQRSEDEDPHVMSPFEKATESVERVRSELSNYVKSEYSKSKKRVIRGSSVDTDNTVVASGVIEWFGLGRENALRIPAVPSGNPMHKSKNVKRLLYTTKTGGEYRTEPARYHEENEIGGSKLNKGEHGNCAEQKVLLMARRDVLSIKYWKGEKTYPSLTIISEKTPCRVCEKKILAFMKAHPDVSVFITAGRLYTGNFASTWDYEGSDGDYHLMLMPKKQSPITGTMVEKPKPKKETSTVPVWAQGNPFALLSLE
jgi:hypothetical protein